MNTKIEELAKKHDLQVDFVNELHEKVIDKANFERALKMFVDGLLPYDIATGQEPINVAAIRHDIAKNIWDLRTKQRKEYEARRDYYQSCLYLHNKGNKGVQEAVFIKDGVIVAFAHYEPRQGGIYAANNEISPNFNWQPHEYLGRLRKIDRRFYKHVKKAASNSPREWFDFNLK